MRFLTLAAAAGLMLAAAGCNDAADTTAQPMTDADLEKSRDVAAAEDAAGHHHTAPHGGRLIELGSHQYNLELVYPDGEMMTVYALGPHASQPVMLAAEDIELELDLEGGEEREIELTAVDPVDGKASKFTAPASEFGDATSLDDLEAHVHVTIDGTKFDGELSHGDHGHGHDDHGHDDHEHADGEEDSAEVDPLDLDGQ